MIKLAALALAGAALFGSTPDVPAAPPLEHPIVDETGTLTSTETDTLSNILDAGRIADGRETGVLVIDHLPKGQTIEEYSIDVARDWAIGDDAKDNGVLVLVALGDHKLRVEVGRGLEGDITDSEARNIVDNLMVPKMKDNDLYAALTVAANAIHSPDLGAAATTDRAEVVSPVPTWTLTVAVLAFAVLLLGGSAIFIISDRLSARRYDAEQRARAEHIRTYSSSARVREAREKLGRSSGSRTPGRPAPRPTRREDGIDPLTAGVIGYAIGSSLSDNSSRSSDSSSSGGGFNFGGGGGGSFGGGDFGGGGDSGSW
ncbi:TPM domain-containing protein [Leifsonia sp. Leaf264]|uniref:TPM domain-containing protein n=1 Tax=Leifsonia sp. Leaf264 TaxID=1736314 RepID=UPI0006F42E08|nr:TPM domain-containing protein [Leifsonia sp. Leaf264]KQO98721.1 hypothetical protein ASF30_11710 [Leifsonia sp. Leaf264]